MESIGALLTSSLAAYLVYVNGLRASDIGFSLTMAGKSFLYLHYMMLIYKTTSVL